MRIAPIKTPEIGDATHEIRDATGDRDQTRRHAGSRRLPAIVVAAVSALGGLLASAPSLAATETTVVSLSGENTVGTTMARTLAVAYAKELKLGEARVELGATPDEYEVVAEGLESTRSLHVKVRARGHGFGLEPLLRGQIDFWMAAAPVREADLETMRKRGVPNVPTLEQMTQPGTENVIALSALTVVVSPKNPVRALSFKQLQDIFAGRIANWAQVEGPANLPIGLYSPEPTMATANLFCARVLGVPDTGKCLDSFPRLAAPRIELMEDLSDAVAGNPGGVGFVDFAARRAARMVPLATECGAPVEPSVFRIATDEYPIVRKHLFYTAPNRPLSPAATAFLKLTLGPVGQDAAAAAGMAPLTPTVASPEYGDSRLDKVRDALDNGATHIRAADARTFETAIAGADRLSIAFRFQTGTNALDSRAEADLIRLAELLKDPRYSQTEVSLIGFSSATGDYSANQVLSKDRAEAVRARLLALGISKVSAVGVGPAAAIACNLSPATASVNQRVEVWLRKPRS